MGSEVKRPTVFSAQQIKKRNSSFSFLQFNKVPIYSWVDRGVFQASDGEVRFDITTFRQLSAP